MQIYIFVFIYGENEKEKNGTKCKQNKWAIFGELV